MSNPSENRPNLPFSIDELRLLVDQLDQFVKSATLATMQNEPTTKGCPSTVVDKLTHLRGLLHLAQRRVQEIENGRR